MSFDSGSISFQRYAVIGKMPADWSHAHLLGKMELHKFHSPGIGVPEDVEWGWAGARHVLDAAFDVEHCVFNDCIHVGLRIDTNTVPAAIKQAHQHIEETAAAAKNPSGFISKRQKRECKDNVTLQIEQDMREGKYRRSKLIPLLWDVPAGIVYGPSSISVREKLQELFSRTFELELQPLTSGHLALREMERLGKRGAYEDFTPTRFAKSQADPDMPAEYPWTAKGDGVKDFLGNEFLLWLWYRTQKNGTIDTAVGTVTVMFDRTLQMDCAFGQTGKDTIAATGPTRSAEAFEALRAAKVPRRAGLIVDCPSGQFNLTLTGESLVVSSLKLPEIEKADTARTLFEERITLLRDFNDVLCRLFTLFLSGRSIGWVQAVEGISKWIKVGK